MPFEVVMKIFHANVRSVALISVAVLPLAGCGLGTVQLSGPAPVSSVQGTGMTGKIYGGQQPVTGATIQLYAAGTSGYGTGATPLIASGNYFVGGAPNCVANSTVTCTSLPQSDGNGNFTITGDYSCPSSASQVYLVATGGNPGISTNPNFVAGAAPTSGSGATATLSVGTSVLFSGSTISIQVNGVADYAGTVAAGTTLAELSSQINAGALSVTTSVTGGNVLTVTGPVGTQNTLSFTGTALTDNPNNPALALMAGLGSCGSLNASTTVNINEATTVATVWALQQFMSATYGTAGVFGIGAPSTSYNGVQSAQVAMANSFSIIPNMVNISVGTPGPTTSTSATTVNVGTTLVPNVSVEKDKIATLANIIASCINTSGGTQNGDMACSTLFADAKPTGQSNAAADTIQAALDIATNPGNNVAALIALAGAQPPFSGGLSTANDFTIAIGYAPQISGADQIVSPYGVAIDAYGNAWFDNSNSSALDGPLEISPTGALIAGPYHTFTASGNCASAPCTPAQNTLASSTRTFTKAKGIGIDLNGYVWATNNSDALASSGAASVAVLQGSSAAGVGSPTATGSAVGYYTTASPYNVAIDPANTVYVVGNASVTASPISIFPVGGASNSSTGTAYQAAGGTLPSVAYQPYGISIDTNTAATGGPFLWIGETSGCSTVGAIQQYNTTGANAYQPTANSAIADATTSACAVTSQTVADTISATTNLPLGTAIDANNNVWVVNSTASTSAGVTYLVPTATGAVGSTSTSSVTLTNSPATVTTSQYVAVDGFNKAWVSQGSGNTVAVYTVSTTSGSPVITATPSTGIIHSESVSATNATKVQTVRQLAIDGSGNVWMSGNSSSAGSYVVMIVGAAGPVVTPLVQAVKSKKLGQKP
jgi:hypothetical protein